MTLSPATASDSYRNKSRCCVGTPHHDNRGSRKYVLDPRRLAQRKQFRVLRNPQKIVDSHGLFPSHCVSISCRTRRDIFRVMSAECRSRRVRGSVGTARTRCIASNISLRTLSTDCASGKSGLFTLRRRSTPPSSANDRTSRAVEGAIRASSDTCLGLRRVTRATDASDIT
jgi:hypothetical protein